MSTNNAGFLFWMIVGGTLAMIFKIQPFIYMFTACAIATCIDSICEAIKSK